MSSIRETPANGLRDRLRRSFDLGPRPDARRSFALPCIGLRGSSGEAACRWGSTENHSNYRVGLADYLGLQVVCGTITDYLLFGQNALLGRHPNNVRPPWLANSCVPGYFETRAQTGRTGLRR
jgi:hypothetical protein